MSPREPIVCNGQGELTGCCCKMCKHECLLVVVSACAWCWLEYKLPFGDNKDCLTELSTVTEDSDAFLYLAQGFIEHARRSLFTGATYRGVRERLFPISYKK